MKTPKFDAYLKASVREIQEGCKRPLSMESKFYVYVLMDPRYPGPHEYRFLDKVLVLPYRPFYVGKGKGRRIYNHLAEARKGKGNSHKLNLMRKLLSMGLMPKGRILCKPTDEATAFAKEKYLIKVLPDLTNLCEGGEGPSGAVRSPETRKKLSDALKGRPRGYAATEETRAKISAANAGKKRTPEQNAANSAARKGKPGHKHSEEARAKMREAAKNRKPRVWTEEQKRARSEAYKGRVLRPEWTDAQKKAASRGMKTKWKDADYADTQVTKQNRGRQLARLVG